MPFTQEQESQIVAPLYGPPFSVPSSPTAHEVLHSFAQSNKGSSSFQESDTIDNPHEQEAEQYSLKSRVAETRFVDLEHDTQALDDVGELSPTSQRLLQPILTGPSGEALSKGHTVVAFVRPNAVGEEDPGAGFKFTAVAKPAISQFPHPQGNTLNGNSSSEVLGISKFMPMVQPKPDGKYK